MHRSHLCAFGLATALFLGLAGPVCAQKVFKCGNTYSHIPCASDAAVKPVYGGQAPDKPAGLTGYELCAAEAPGYVNSPEPGSTRIRALGPSTAEAIRYAGSSIVAHRHDLGVELKLQQGSGYSGSVTYSCWVSEDQRRILQFTARRN